MRPGETKYRPAEPAAGETFAGEPVMHVIENGLGDRAGIVVRAGGTPCVALVRGSFVVGRRWPWKASHLREVGALLIRQYTDSCWNPGDPGSLWHFGRDAAEIDALGVHVLRAVAGDLDRLSKGRTAGAAADRPRRPAGSR